MPPLAFPPRVNQLAYRVWRDLSPKPALSDVRLKFLNRLRDVVEAATELVGTALFALLGGVAGATARWRPLSHADALADPAGTGRDGRVMRLFAGPPQLLTRRRSAGRRWATAWRLRF